MLQAQHGSAEDAVGSDFIAGFNLQYSIHAEYLVSLAAQSGKAVSMLVFVSFQSISCLCQKFPSK